MGYGYSENDIVSFSELHFIAFLIHLISAIFATALVPGDEFATRALTFTQYDIKKVNCFNSELTTDLLNPGNKFFGESLLIKPINLLLVLLSFSSSILIVLRRGYFK